MRIGGDKLGPHPDNVAQFKRPDLDAELITCLEQLEEADHWLRYYMGQLAEFTAVRDALGTRVKPHLAQMLDDELASLTGTVEYIESLIAGWKEIIEILKSRTARL
ncbi:MAG: hypothetical protein QG615_513 [Nitrospirota bacterium]|nr:hypothetical protein [Nitrospirota bacterium]